MSSRRRPATGSSSTALAASYLGALLWLALPIVALWLLWEESGNVSLSEPSAIAIPAEEPPAQISEPADIVLVWSQPQAVFAPTWHGTTQMVFVEPGAMVTSGTEVAVIDNVVRVAWSTEVPLFRAIAWGDEGRDVAALNQFLASQGLPHNSGDQALWSTVQGIKRYAERIGAGSTSAFDHTWLVYLEESFVVSEVDGLSVGAPAPAPGSEILIGESKLTSAFLAEPLATGVDPQSVVATAMAIDSTQSLVFRNTRLSVDQDGVVDLSSLGHFVNGGGLRPGELRVGARVETTVPSGTVAIPYGAIVQDDGQSCVAVAAGDGFEVAAVEPVLPGPGRAYVSGDVRLGELVIVPPPHSDCSMVEAR